MTRANVRIGPNNSDTVSKRGSKELRQATAAVLKLPENRDRSPEEKREIVLATSDQGPLWEALKSVRAQAAEMIGRATATLSERRATFAASGDPDDATLVGIAESALRQVREHWRLKESGALAAWNHECNRRKGEAALAGHLDYLRGFLAGEPRETEYRSNIGSYAHPTEDLCRWLGGPFGVAVILAKEAIESGKLPTHEREAHVSSEYRRAEDCVLANNRDRNALPHISYGPGRNVQLEVDQVSAEELDAKCAELGHVPTNEEIRAMFRGPGKDEAYKAKVAADAEARRNSPATKKLQQSVQELLARGRSTKV